MKTVLPLLLVFLAGCDDRPRQWDAMIYLEDDSSMEPYQAIRGFKTFELCQSAAIEQLSRLPQPEREKAYYDCGYMCRFDPQFGHTICKESRD